MLRRNAGRIAVGVWLVSIALALARHGPAGLDAVHPAPTSWGFPGASQLATVTLGTIGAVVLRRQPLNAIGWLFAGIGLFFAVEAWSSSTPLPGRWPSPVGCRSSARSAGP